MDNKDHKIDDAIAKVCVIVLVGVMMACIFCQSCSPKIIKEVYTEVVYRDREVHDTATVEIPLIIENNVTKDTTSHLENKYAKSDAIVSQGLLWHSLETRPQIIEVPVIVHVTDTLIRESESESNTEYVEVERKMKWWESAMIGTYPYMVVAVIGLILFIIGFRKKLFKI